MSENKNQPHPVRYLSGEALTRTVREGLSFEEIKDALELRLPWCFGAESTELVITISRQDLPYSSPQPFKQKYGKSSVDTEKHDTYIISDGGRAFAELEKRVGDTSPYMPRIKRLLESTGMNTLRGGRIIERAYSAYAVHQHLRCLNCLLNAVTLVASLDILPPFGSCDYSDERERELSEIRAKAIKTVGGKES